MTWRRSLTIKNTEFEKLIGYTFSDGSLLETALTHSSYTREHGREDMKDNERLEYLGDAFFDAIAGEVLYQKLPEENEGILTKRRAQIVREDSLAEVGRSIGIGDYLNLGRGEEHTGGRDNTSIIADATEALIGSVFLDGGYEAARGLVIRLFGKQIEDAVAGKDPGDYKSRLQEEYQKNGPVDIVYSLDREEGPSHDRSFFMTVYINGTAAGSGFGKSKKEAGQNAAKEALEKLEK